MAAARQGPRSHGDRSSQCHAGEAIVWSCTFASAIGSVCGAPGRLSYRYGPAGHPAITISSDADWSNVHLGTIVGGGGGRQNHIRFSRGPFDYVVFEGEAGQLTENPGRRWSGIYVAQDGNPAARLECPGRARMETGSLADLRRWQPPGRQEETEERDERFQLWF